MLQRPTASYHSLFGRALCTITLAILVVVSFSSALSSDTIYVGTQCTSGELQCQEDEIRQCTCEMTYDEFSTIVHCAWEYYSSPCEDEESDPNESEHEITSVPSCDASTRGAEFKFSGGEIKECICRKDDDGEFDDCSWD